MVRAQPNLYPLAFIRMILVAAVARVILECFNDSALDFADQRWAEDAILSSKDVEYGN